METTQPNEALAHPTGLQRRFFENFWDFKAATFYGLLVCTARRVKRTVG
jgi:hypothetical protein